MIKRRRWLWLILGTAASVAAAFFSAWPAQENSREKKKEEWIYGVSVTSVSLSVTVQDKGGKYINDLTRTDFSIYENNVRQTITHFMHDFKAPLSLTILLDVSGSMALQDKMDESRAALRDFIKNTIGPKDELALLIFADGEVEVASRYSEDNSGLLDVLEKTEAYGKTALNDAVAVSPEFARRGKYEKKALLLITDGIENDSQYSPLQAAEIAKAVEVPIYTIGYKLPLNDRYLGKFKRAAGLTPIGIVESLERFSRATGGKAFFADTPEKLRASLREIKTETSHQYILGFTSHADAKGGFRKIKVLTRNKKHKIRTREGY